MDKSKVWKMVVVLAAIVVLANGLNKLVSRNSLSLSEYAGLHTSPSESGDTGQEQLPPEGGDAVRDTEGSPSGPDREETAESPLTGASLNGDSCLDRRVTLAEGFYYEPISDKLRRYITGISCPAVDEADGDGETVIGELSYLHILHYDFDGSPREGELICNTAIAQDLGEIFRELYRNEYKLEKVLLIDEYDGDEAAALEDNNSSCFRYSAEEGSHAARHAQGLAVDINPLYNPYITYGEDGSEATSPQAASAYADRSLSFPYKIDEEDLCYKLFTRYGFTWGGNWNDGKGFQHFQKTP